MNINTNTTKRIWNTISQDNRMDQQYINGKNSEDIIILILEMILVYKRIYRYVLCVTVFLEILKETKDACTCNRVKWSRGLRPSLHTRVQ